MSRFKLTIKWRFTLMVVIIVTITSAVLITAINYDIGRSMPELTENILSQTQFEIPIEDYYVGNDNNINLSGEDAVIIIEGAIGETVSNIYTTSIIVFFIIIILSGICTYFIVNKALRPIVKLNSNIKKINEDNLNCNLDIEGPQDEIKELTISFNKMIAKLDNAFDSQKRFNASVAHELKTPLAVIKTNIDVLKSCDDKSIEEYEDTLAIVEKSILRMNTMIEALLDIIRQENAPLNESIIINEIIEDVVDDLTIIAKKNDISIYVEIDEIKSKIIGNEILLYRALYNIIENSVKYSMSNGYIKILAKEEKDTIKIIIKDTGIGIDKKKLDKIFEPFYRCEDINALSSSGMGLGLSLTKSVINMHGGEIKVESEVNKGTKFMIILPINI
ncbi:HAMP domain-containing sensor histidine kinase [Clostridium sp. D53t1_180928_C8]|uniref:sensor histidine kinase n=1 Tax=Clostridium sp. D53t1_180928_C8 TaxID=2787101 RepID=UPI0018AAD019|nr:HAMP domain-containing sensor histidine kinase [Clostridium sp. D53t1_180928_C8]